VRDRYGVQRQYLSTPLTAGRGSVLLEMQRSLRRGLMVSFGALVCALLLQGLTGFLRHRLTRRLVGHCCPVQSGAWLVPVPRHYATSPFQRCRQPAARLPFLAVSTRAGRCGMLLATLASSSRCQHVVERLHRTGASQIAKAGTPGSDDPCKQHKWYRGDRFCPPAISPPCATDRTTITSRRRGTPDA
jgi:hypothetical protein